MGAVLPALRQAPRSPPGSLAPGMQPITPCCGQAWGTAQRPVAPGVTLCPEQSRVAAGSTPSPARAAGRVLCGGLGLVQML